MGLTDEFVPGTTTALLLVVLFAVVGYAAVAGLVADEPLETARSKARRRGDERSA